MRLFVLFLFVASFSHAQALDEGFDKPLKKTVVDLGVSPFYLASQDVRSKLTCYYYSSFTVKEYDQGEKGAEWLSIVPSPHAACTLRHTDNEKVYVYPEWGGYFRGARGTFAFFDAPDGTDGGMPFAIFDVRTGRKLFEDSSLLAYYQKKLHINNAFRIASGGEQLSLLTYFRVVRAGCDIKTELGGCWNRVRAKLGITQTDMPVCSRYENAEGKWESAIVYPVSVLLTDTPEIKATEGPVFCWPID